MPRWARRRPSQIQLVRFMAKPCSRITGRRPAGARRGARLRRRLRRRRRRAATAARTAGAAGRRRTRTKRGAHQVADGRGQAAVPEGVGVAGRRRRRRRPRAGAPSSDGDDAQYHRRNVTTAVAWCQRARNQKRKPTPRRAEKRPGWKACTGGAPTVERREREVEAGAEAEVDVAGDLDVEAEGDLRRAAGRVSMSVVRWAWRGSARLAILARR